ncbi:MAG: hypothetical protein ICV83_30625 [Cytophagales bacterium]|nr:hypothetical protein [Cytophagales bacterium]
METRYNRRNALFLAAGREEDPACPHAAMPVMDWLLAAAPGNDGGGGAGQEAEKQKPAAPDPKPTTPDPPQSITDPKSPLTGDTGNLELGQTDLGASGTGSEDPLATDDKDA